MYKHLVGKRVMFYDGKQSQKPFYHDATVKEIAGHYFLKYNTPDEKIFDIEEEAKRLLKKENGDDFRITLKVKKAKILDMLFEEFYKCNSGVYKNSYALEDDGHSYKPRYTNIRELTRENVEDLFFRKHPKGEDDD